MRVGLGPEDLVGPRDPAAWRKRERVYLCAAETRRCQSQGLLPRSRRTRQLAHHSLPPRLQGGFGRLEYQVCRPLECNQLYPSNALREPKGQSTFDEKRQMKRMDSVDRRSFLKSGTGLVAGLVGATGRISSVAAAVGSVP